ncbi:DUF1553 domain-containing protein [Thalassoroseus pseudoceratinae]|uniref:DUF1553 domain-containing protein n=1 Tax=Thalassoroseus pseudoceratinae TaxID=2713176 RepID=UPI00141EAF01|nr:DUF1553 domain-containing protein [Thalassoroseus pseudoceratinae]
MNLLITTTQFTVFFLATGLFLPGASAGEDIDFQSQVAPIFERRCLSCHNDTDSQGDLSLQTATSSWTDGVIIAGDVESSYLVHVITPVDGQAEMPKNADSLSAEEIATVRKWIASGAKWPKEVTLREPEVTDFDWWSYRRIERPKVPAIHTSWARTSIDKFIQKQLDDHGLTHAAEADRRTLIRRVTYDLIGLPPTPGEVAAFVRSSDPLAYERLVDRLLASPQYGERWARHWLDVVKYADTHGYDKDKLRPNAWPYRDYVVRALNDDKPFSRFVQEQIAGDVLFPGEPDGILGLGFLAAGPWDFIGHVEVPESKLDGKVARNLDRDDMVSNTLNTFCSVTVQCARCHNHKFDPISQENYYGLQSVFAAVDRADRVYDLDPTIERRRYELASQLADLRKQKSALETEITKAGGPRLKELQQTIAELQSARKIVKEPEFGYHSGLANQPDVEKWVEVDLGQDVAISRIVLRPCHDDFGGIGAGFGFPRRFRVQVAIDDDWHPVLDRTADNVSNPGVSAFAIENVNQTARKVRVTATKLADRSGVFILALAELQVFTDDGMNAALGAKVASLDSIEAPVRWRRQNLTDGKWATDTDPARSQQLSNFTRERDRLLKQVMTPERTSRQAKIAETITRIEEEQTSLPTGRHVYAAATQFPSRGQFHATKGKPRTVFVLNRGDVQTPGPVAVPSVLPLSSTSNGQLDSKLSEADRRAALAQWLTDRDHPLVWRSIVNRIWQYHFGHGLVATPNDFGRMGALPTHPKLLDWLAAEFRDGGQSMKQLHRLIVTSSVYRQSSEHNEANAAIDGSNQFLWRMNRRRLEAEEIRDSILAVSGAMNSQMGGPGFYLFNLEKTAHSPHYQYHKFDPTDTASHRRSIYRFVVRSQPDPWMTTLDCADSSQSTPKRSETLTSLQALSLLNNRFNLVMAERFANRLRAESPTRSEQVAQAIRLITQREPTDWEHEELVEYSNQYGLDNMCRYLFNLSEFVFLD